jgi:hypothetical protein
MSAVTVASIAFVCIFGGAILGLVIRSILPDHHMSNDARDVVKLGAGLIATLAALVLGLLVSSAKGTLDTMNSGLTQDGAKIILLDRILANYGPETKDIRELMRSNVVSTINRIWPEDKTGHVSLRTIEAARSAEEIQDKLRGLSPRSDSQRQLQSQALQIAADLAQSRWVLIEQTQEALPTTFIVVLVFWLTVLFAAFGLLSPGNATVITVLFVCALSVSGAIFLILEMNTPLSGIIKVSSAPMYKALENLGR